MKYPIEAIREHIIKTVTDAEGGISGADLRSAIVLKFPEFDLIDYNVLKIRDLVTRFVPEVVQSGRRGGDIIYTCRAAGESDNENLSVDNLSVWRTFASPNSPYRLFVDRGTGRLSVYLPNHTPPDGSILIPPMPPARHIELAKMYLDSLTDDSQRQRLQQHLLKPQWWIPFFDAIKEEKLGPSWNAARTKFISHELKIALEKAGAPSARVDSEIAASRRAETAAMRSSRAAPMASDGSIPKLRLIAATLIQRMSDTELRRLRVRLGDVFDALDV
jgi:hypothetical protein